LKILLLPWDDISVTHIKKITKLKEQVNQNDPKISQKRTQVATKSRKGEKGTKLGKKGPKKSINRGGNLILTIAIWKITKKLKTLFLKM
jgi:UDP-N-acetylglucosamine pyrophosphorylase